MKTRTRNIIRSAGIAALIAGCVIAQSSSTIFAALAQSLNETFENWQVLCSSQTGPRRCVASQQQAGPQRQRFLAVELIPAAGNTLTGTLALPFDLQAEAGASLQVDDRPIGRPLRVRHCGPAGCLVSLQLDSATTDKLRMGTTLKILATRADNGMPMVYSLSLEGFAAAISRVTVLTR
ncbi:MULTISPECIES: invasion associated locus B family protein [unclassified Beijerinckia]|uniref:invasion associated locus B family protein n=1 Tax=unclassified Beijerinckia TaxID=2638183 RepID=UPI0008975F1C|nr:MULTISPECIES: invasion associated locus B family protein [unclassified Beijerinckia]MDH7794065.1 invasion protein IalB [Beijerinckia sp. GAS462]SEB52512.1 Invasion protein IalB, involved in pathogenesis [Beijerinckia sp. 28-YEA-48]